MFRSVFASKNLLKERSLKYLKTTQAWPPRDISVGEDLISKLPDYLICQILSYLPLEEAVRISVLSSRWKSLYLLIPELELIENKFPDYNTFVSFVDRFMDLCREHKSCLHKLEVRVRKNVNDPPCVRRWIDVVARRKIQHLDVKCIVSRKLCEEMPLSLYTCETLVYLRLHRVFLGKFESVSLPCLKTMHLEEVFLGKFESVSLPCLKTMRLEENVYGNDVVPELLISSCQVLEDLSFKGMVKDNLKVLRVHSQTLSSLRLGGYVPGFEFNTKLSAVSIDAPRLEHLNIQDGMYESIIITNSGSLAEVNFDLDFIDVADLAMRNMVRKLLTSISRVRHIKLSMKFSLFLYQNMDFDPLPQFCNLSYLRAKFYLSCLDSLPTLLESCPNLKSLDLVLGKNYAKEDVEINLSSVPRCLVSSLEFVEIEYFRGEPFEMELARYFLENSGVLKELVVLVKHSRVEGRSCLLRDLFALPRGSSACQIIIC